jgi:putative ABC transport system permease protein
MNCRKTSSNTHQSSIEKITTQQNRNMNLIVRNLLHVLRRFKLAAILNILGLSVAFAAFMIIMMQLRFDFGFDRFHKDYDRIFRLESSIGGTHFPFTSRVIAESFFQFSPHIVTGTVMQTVGTDFFHIQGEDEQRRFTAGIVLASDEIFDVFTFDIVDGSKEMFGTSPYIMIPQSLARRMFGDESAVGKQIVTTVLQVAEEDRLPTIGAVYRDFPANSILSNSIYVSMPEGHRTELADFHFLVFARINDVPDINLLPERFIQQSGIVPAEWWERVGGGIDLRLTPLPDIRFISDVSHDIIPKANRQILMILLAIGIIIIIIAGINFTNFSTALMPMRVKNINTQRVFGVRRNTIRRILVIESVIFSIVGYLIALLLVRLFSGTELANLLDTDLLLTDNLLVAGGTALVAILVGIFVGLYPARYITSFAPALALKGNFGLSPKGKRLRNTLIGIQFVASFVLIIGASFIYLQNRFMQNADLGFDRDKLITVNISGIWNNCEAFLSQIRTHPGVEDITYGQSLLPADNPAGRGGEYEGQTFMYSFFPVHYTFLQVMGIEISEGRDFRREDNNVLIFNETAKRQFNMELNRTVNNREIIGFVPDIKFAPLHRIVEPMAFWVSNSQALPQTYIKVKADTDMRAVMSHVRSTIAEFNPVFPIEPRFHDEVLQQLYEKETKLSLLISLFSLIAIFISIVGVFGLVVFDSECRRKEIGIRKVLGASTMEIITMFNKTYVKMLLICFVIAAPLAWYAVSRWLENFAYRMPMYWWVYLLAFIAVAAITILTVTIQNWRVANDDPVKSIKTE